MQSDVLIIARTSINYQQPSPQLLPYAVTKAGIATMVTSLAWALAAVGSAPNGLARRQASWHVTRVRCCWPRRPKPCQRVRRSVGRGRPLSAGLC
jgi:NAD(P)-dependent dehydrogenase (short-subunit alcohol dehydrogenase family)